VVGHDDIDEAAEAAEIDAQNAVNDEWLAWVRSQQPDGLLPYERKKKLEAEQAAEASGDSEAGP